MNKFNLLTMILFTGMAAAQSPATQPTPVKPAQTTVPAVPDKVTPLESAGLNKIAQDYQTVLQELSQANIDVSKNHPGFHLDPKNPLSGVLLKDEPAPAPEAKGNVPFKADKPAEPVKTEPAKK
jgi:hypothetical protein